MQLNLKELLSRFSSTISKGSLGLVDYAPEPSARPMNSIQNVLLRLKRDGGTPLFGWVFLSRESVHGQYLIALHHAIWSPSGSSAPIDITPIHEDPKYQPYWPTPGKVLFLMDEAAQPKMIGSSISPLPSRFFPATEDADLAAYVDQLNEEEQSHFQKLCESGVIPAGSQRTH
jgi:hypothetical protein